MYFVRDVDGEHYQEISPIGQQFMVTFGNGEKMVLGLWYMINFTSGLGLLLGVSLVRQKLQGNRQSVETATMISQEVGDDAGKKIHGRKRHLTVDLLGLVLRVLVTSASLPERQGAQQVLNKVHGLKGKVKRLHTIWMDGGYRGDDLMRWVMDVFHWIVEIVLRPLEKKGFVHLPKRWVVERTFGWLNW